MKEETTKQRGRAGQFFATGLFYFICLLFLLPLILIATIFEKLGEFSEILSDFATDTRKNLALSLRANLWDESVEALRENKQLKQVNKMLEEELERATKKDA